MNNKITGAEALMRSLEHNGVKTIFGYPGGSIMPVYDALYDHLGSLHHILVRHEQGAVHAAEGFARATGEVGVCVVTSGPGATNTITGIADAMIDNTPIVVIAGQVGSEFLGSDAFQEVDLVGVTQPISKWSYQIRRAEDVAWAVSRAFYIAATGCPGPVVLDFAKSAQMGLTEYFPKTVDFVRGYVPVPETTEESLQNAAMLIDNARRPLVLVGHGVELGCAQEELLRFVEKADLPCGCTMLGLSALPSDHKLNKGMLGMHGNLAPNVKTNEADVIIAVGMRFDDRVTGNVDTYARQAKVIHLDIDPSQVNKNISVDVAVMGDCKATLRQLTDRISANDHSEWIESFDSYYAKELACVIDRELHPTDGPLLMGEVINAVSEATRHNAILVTDVGQNQLLAARYFKFCSPRSIITSGGLGTMGFGLPAAIGAAVGRPDRTVCLFLGDGGMQMSIQELGTIMEHGMAVKIILLNNNYLGNVRQWQAMFFNRRYSFSHMMNPDFVSITSAYNIPGESVSERADLPSAIRRMLTAEGSYFLEVAVIEEGKVLPMSTPGSSVDEMVLDC